VRCKIERQNTKSGVRQVPGGGYEPKRGAENLLPFNFDGVTGGTESCIEKRFRFGLNEFNPVLLETD
jgi:hypothetical protein